MMVLPRHAMSGAVTLSRRMPAVRDPLARVAAATATMLSCAWATAAFLVLLRRFGGSFSDPPTAAMPWVTALAGLVITFGISAALEWGAALRWSNLVARIGTLVAVLAVMPFVGSTTQLAMAVVPLAIAGAPVFVPSLSGIQGSWRARRSGRVTSRARRSPANADPGPATAIPLSAGFRQRLERFQTTADGDRAIGRVIVDVPAGSRSGHAHIGFCPPFASMPTVDVSSNDDGFEAVVTAAEVVPWGVRVECRLLESAEEPLAIPVDVVARYPG